MEANIEYSKLYRNGLTTRKELGDLRHFIHCIMHMRLVAFQTQRIPKFYGTCEQLCAGLYVRVSVMFNLEKAGCGVSVESKVILSFSQK